MLIRMPTQPHFHMASAVSGRRIKPDVVPRLVSCAAGIVIIFYEVLYRDISSSDWYHLSRYTSVLCVCVCVCVRACARVLHTVSKMRGSDRLQRPNKIMSPNNVHWYLTDTNLRAVLQITEWNFIKAH